MQKRLGIISLCHKPSLSAAPDEISSLQDECIDREDIDSQKAYEQEITDPVKYLEAVRIIYRLIDKTGEYKFQRRAR